MRIDALSADMIGEAAALIAREHQHTLDRGVPLPSRYLDVAACSTALSALLSEGFSGFVARQGARLVGVMCGKAVDGVGFVPAHGIALEPGALDPTMVTVSLFAELAPVLVAQGAIRVTVDHLDNEKLALALFDLGFGRGGMFAVRGTEPIDAEPSVEVRIGTAADLTSIATLSHVEFLYRSMPPMYGLDQTRSLGETHAVHERLLHDGAIHLLARYAGRDVGLLPSNTQLRHRDCAQRALRTSARQRPIPTLAALGSAVHLSPHHSTGHAVAVTT